MPRYLQALSLTKDIKNDEIYPVSSVVEYLFARQFINTGAGGGAEFAAVQRAFYRHR